VVTDVADLDSVRNLHQVATERFGNIHVLFNNAGVGGGGAMVADDDLDMWEWTLGVNLWGVLYGIKVFGPSMIAHGEPCHIVNTASMAGLLATPGLGAYTVSKYSVVAMSETLSVETRETNMGVSVLCPGFVQTKIAESDRNLPEHLVSQDEPTAEMEFMRDMVRDLVAGGIKAEQVADNVYDAIVEGRFAILTHPQYGPQIEARSRGIVAGDLPQTWDI
jgi:NAD(P)-dependent dehydrogenase (short-subunit alcohol dehydrogenase family)